MHIDTLKAARRLQEDDTFSPEQAERIAEILSDLDVASATKDDLDDLEDRLTSHINHLGERIDRLDNRIDETNSHIDRLDEKMATQSDLKAMKSVVSAVENRLGKKIEEKQSATIRTLVGTVAAVGAILAVVIPLAIYLMG